MFSAVKTSAPSCWKIVTCSRSIAVFPDVKFYRGTSVNATRHTVVRLVGPRPPVNGAATSKANYVDDSRLFIILVPVNCTRLAAQPEHYSAATTKLSPPGSFTAHWSTSTGLMEISENLHPTQPRKKKLGASLKRAHRQPCSRAEMCGS